MICIVLLMPIYVIASDVNLYVKNELTQNPVEYAKVELEGDTKETDKEGVVNFTEVGNKTHIVTIDKEGYRQTTKEINVSSIKYKEVELERDEEHALGKEFDETSWPNVTIENLENNTIVEDESLEVEFSVESDFSLERCTLLVQKKSQYGYTIKDTLEEMEEKEGSFSSMLSNGNLFVRVMCENKAGQGYSAAYSITAKGFEEDRSTEDLEESGEEKKEIEKPSLVKEIETIKEKLDSSPLDSFEESNEELMNLLGFSNIKEKGMDELEEIKQRRIDLEGLNMGESDYTEQKNELWADFRELKGELPKNVEIANDHNFILPVTLEETEEALQIYLENRYNESDVSQYSEVVEQSRERQDNISIYSTIEQVEVHLLDNSTKGYTKVTKEMDDGGISEGFYLEILPERVVDSLNDIEFSTRYNTVDGLTTLRFSPEHNEYSYLLDGKKNTSLMGDAKTVYLLDPVRDTNTITGLLISATPANPGSTFALALLVVSILSAGIITYRSGISLQNIPFNLNKQQKGSEDARCALLLREAIEHIKKGNNMEAIRLYPSILKNFKNLGPKSKKELQPMIAYISGMADLQYLNSLIDKACEQMEQGPVDSELVREVEECYHSLDDNLIKEVKQKYEWFKELVDLKMQRKDEQVKQIILREKKGENLSYGVDDTLFGA